MKKILEKIIFAFAGLCAPAAGCFGEEIVVGLGGNAYVTDGAPAIRSNAFMGGVRGIGIGEGGVRDWRNPAAAVSVFFSPTQPQREVFLSLTARGNAVYEVRAGGEIFRVPVDSEDFQKYFVGKIAFADAGYQRVEIRALEKSGETFGEISEISLDGIEGEVDYVRDFSDYWGRRGPSVHVAYAPPRTADIEYFYNEVCVPAEADVVGTYYMVCGFREGYFGFQVNSPRERRILFSVWSPTDTEDPGEIPEDERIALCKKGDGVQVQDFGNEGSGAQSFLNFPWRAGTTYKFLMRVRPVGEDSTEFSGYFFAPEENAWRLIASFLRPKTNTWLTRPHSFLENFSPNLGWKMREVSFGNQWARDTDGRWHELTDGLFSCDTTGTKRRRVDYFGGLSADKKSFLLKNCGFFNETTPAGTPLKRIGGEASPQIDFEKIEALTR